MAKNKKKVTAGRHDTQSNGNKSASNQGHTTCSRGPASQVPEGLNFAPTRRLGVVDNESVSSNNEESMDDNSNSSQKQLSNVNNCDVIVKPVRVTVNPKLKQLRNLQQWRKTQTMTRFKQLVHPVHLHALMPHAMFGIHLMTESITC